MNVKSFNQTLAIWFGEIIEEPRSNEPLPKFLQKENLLKEQKTEREFGIALWKCIIREFENLNSNLRSEVLNQFKKIGSEIILSGRTYKVNSSMYLVSLVESLPTIVWRKFLWESNSDFSSLECFLRRITSVQIELLQKTHDEFISGKIPSVLSKRELLAMAEEANGKFLFEGRYDSKGAWSYNLLGLDFGFNAYPKGEFDDTKDEAISALRFLSIKNHADDFVVNKEFGKYFKYYKMVRSDYVFNPNKNIDIKKHICPGFWYTLIMMFWFFILSPLASVLFVSQVGGYNPSVIQKIFLLMVGIFASLTPIWLILALIKKVFLFCAKGKIGDELNEMIGKFIKSLGKGKQIVSFILGVFFVCLIVWIHLLLKLLPAILISSMITIWAGYPIYKKIIKGFFPRYPKELKLFLKILLFLTALVMILLYTKEFLILVSYLVKGISISLLAIKWFLGLLWKGIILFGWGWFMLLPILLVIYLTLRMDHLEEKEEYVKLKKYSFFFNGIISIVSYTVIGLIIFSWVMLFIQGAFSTIDPSFFFFFFLSILVPFILLNFIIEPKVETYRILDKEFIEEIIHSLKRHAYHCLISSSQLGTILRSVSFNKFLTKENFEMEYSKIVHLSLLFPFGLRINLLNMILRNYNFQTVYMINELYGTVEYTQGSDLEKWDLLFEVIAEKKSIKHAIAISLKKKQVRTKEKESWKNFKDNFKTVLKWIFFPVILIWKGILALRVLKSLSETFNKACPYVYQSKSLSKMYDC